MMLLLAAALAAQQAAANRAAVNRVDVVAMNDTTFRVIGSPVAGLVQIRFTNRTNDIQSAHLVAVQPGRPLPEAERLLRANQGVPWMGNAIGMGSVGPGRTATISQELPAGDYYFVNRRIGADSQPRHTHGALGRMTVTGTLRDAPRLRVDGKIAIENRFVFSKVFYSRNGHESALGGRDFGSPMRIGQRIIRVENTSPLFHDVVVLYSRDSAPQAMTAYAYGRPLPPGVVVVAGLGYVPPGSTAWLHLPMTEAGVYMFFCSMRHMGGPPAHLAGEQAQQFVR